MDVRVGLKKAEHRRIDAFEVWCWRRLLRVPWTARSNQSTLKEINHVYSLEGLMLKLKLQYLGYLMWRTNSLEKTLMLGKVKGRRRRGWEKIRVRMASLTQGHEFELALGVSDRQEAWGAAVHEVTKSWTWLNVWTELNWGNLVQASLLTLV